MDKFRVAMWDELEAVRLKLEAQAKVEAGIAQSLDKVAEAINRLADAYVYVNQPEDEPGFEGQSLSDREHL